MSSRLKPKAQWSYPFKKRFLRFAMLRISPVEMTLDAFVSRLTTIAF